MSPLVCLSSGGQSRTAAKVVDTGRFGFAFKGRGEKGRFGFSEFLERTLNGEQELLAEVETERAVELVGDFDNFASPALPRRDRG